MRDIISNHPLAGKYVDLDWRKPAERNLPYDRSNTNLDHRVLVEQVREDCHGVKWAYLQNRQIPQPISKVCKVYEHP